MTNYTGQSPAYQIPTAAAATLEALGGVTTRRHTGKFQAIAFALSLAGLVWLMVAAGFGD